MIAPQGPPNIDRDSATLNEKKQYSVNEAKQIGESLGILWDYFDVEQFMVGLNFEVEHGGLHSATDVTFDELALAGEKVLTNLNEFPDYYTRLPAEELLGERSERR